MAGSARSLSLSLSPLRRLLGSTPVETTENAISNQFKCKLKTTAAYKLFDSAVKKYCEQRSNGRQDTRPREGGVYGSDGRDRTRKGAPEKEGHRARRRSAGSTRPYIFSVSGTKVEGQRLFRPPLAEKAPLLLDYPAKYLPYRCPDENRNASVISRSQAEIPRDEGEKQREKKCQSLATRLFRAHISRIFPTRDQKERD